jgi:hypothetical protein
MLKREVSVLDKDIEMEVAHHGFELRESAIETDKVSKSNSLLIFNF